jgi:FtsP/CotA-like multicopper oxidase with cupredoxin domain
MSRKSEHGANEEGSGVLPASPTRRSLLVGAGTAWLATRVDAADTPPVAAPTRSARPRSGKVVTLNGRSLPYRLRNGVKEFHLIAEPIEHEFAPGTKVKAWGYNGTSPGPTIEAYEGDRVRIYVTNKLNEHTSVHWHGILLPSGMDGVGGLSQPHIMPGETFVYEFTLTHSGTQMYHPHADEMVQMAMGMMGMFIIHPRDGRHAVDRDFAMLLHNWAVHPGTYRPDPSVMTDFDLWTINGKVFPAIDPLVVRTGQRVRVRVGNLSMHDHPIHIHGVHFKIVGTDAGRVPAAAQWPTTTALVPVGNTMDLEFVAGLPGDWALHCHKSHHTMNAMGHGIPNPIGVEQRDLDARIEKQLPGYMSMGEYGMAEHQHHAGHMQGPPNTLPMMMGQGPYGNLEMGGMFTVMKVRDRIASYADPGWYRAPSGTAARRVSEDPDFVIPGLTDLDRR